jgi:Uma2 family endonuclease
MHEKPPKIPGATMATPALLKSATIDEQMLFDFLDRQGSFSEKEYLALTDHTNRLVEFADGKLEILPMPTRLHQRISKIFFRAFDRFLEPLGGEVLYSPLRLRIRKGKFREPDLLLLLLATDPRAHNRYWTGADLVVEIVSPDKPQRDLVDKRKDYAAAKIPEYWIVNPATEQILVLGLSKKRNRRLGNYRRGDIARSSLLAGFQISVDQVFDAK